MLIAVPGGMSPSASWSRVVPQLNVFAVGFPAKVTVGLVLVGATLPLSGRLAR